MDGAVEELVIISEPLGKISPKQ